MILGSPDEVLWFNTFFRIVNLMLRKTKVKKKKMDVRTVDTQISAGSSCGIFADFHLG